jgi:integrase
MRRINPANEKAKRDYLLWLGATGRKSRATLDQVAAAIDSFAGSTRHADFRTFRPEQAMSYKERLAEQINPATAKPLAKATLHGRLSALKAFFEWLCREPGYRRIRYSDAAYFNLTANEARIATAAREQKTPSLEQVLAVLEAMPADTIVQRRDRALIAFILLTGVRNSAAITLRLKHVDFARGQVSQDAREVRTKGAKTVESVFFPVGDVPHRIVGDWIAELTGTLLFGPDDALFPAARIGLDGEGRFLPVGLKREGLASTAAVCAVFSKAFAVAGLPYHGPHSLRRTLMRLAFALDLTPRELKAWSQNLSHAKVMTSLMSYGQLPFDEQAGVMAGLGEAPMGQRSNEALLRELADVMARHGRA